MTRGEERRRRRSQALRCRVDDGVLEKKVRAATQNTRHDRGHCRRVHAATGAEFDLKEEPTHLVHNQPTAALQPRVPRDSGTYTPAPERAELGPTAAAREARASRDVPPATDNSPNRAQRGGGITDTNTAASRHNSAGRRSVPSAEGKAVDGRAGGRVAALFSPPGMEASTRRGAPRGRRRSRYSAHRAAGGGSSWTTVYGARTPEELSPRRARDDGVPAHKRAREARRGGGEGAKQRASKQPAHAVRCQTRHASARQRRSGAAGCRLSKASAAAACCKYEEKKLSTSLVRHRRV